MQQRPAVVQLQGRAGSSKWVCVASSVADRLYKQTNKQVAVGQGAPPPGIGGGCTAAPLGAMKQAIAVAGQHQVDRHERAGRATRRVRRRPRLCLSLLTRQMPLAWAASGTVQTWLAVAGRTPAPKVNGHGDG